MHNNAPIPVPLVETASEHEDRSSTVNERTTSWVDYLQCFPDHHNGVPPGCWWSICPLNPDNWLFNYSPLAVRLSTFGLNHFDIHRKFYLGMASVFTMLTFIIALWGCFSLSTKRNIVQRTYWYAGTGINSTDNNNFSIYIGLRSVEEVSCEFVPGYDNYQSNCVRHSIKWNSPECHQGLAAPACDSCSAAATGMWITAFMNCFCLILAWLGAQTRMRIIADIPGLQIMQTVFGCGKFLEFGQIAAGLPPRFIGQVFQKLHHIVRGFRHFGR